MIPRLWIVLLSLLILCCLIISTESKFQHQAAVDDDDDEDEDDWDDSHEDEEDRHDDDDENYHPKPDLVDDNGRIYKNPRNSPSANCPRNQEQAKLMGQKCLRKCSTDEDCKSKKKKCRCDGACGMSCIKPDRLCPELPEIKFGLMTVSGRYFGDKAKYTCDPNYFIVGMTERICRADGHWSGVSTTCKKEPSSFCSVPPKMKNAHNNASADQATFELDSAIQYFCNHGYVTKGFQRAKCLMMDGAASWFGPDITCEPQSCGAPTDIANGWHAGECYTYDCRVTYHCADGFELVGKVDKYCLAGGTWNPKESPTCVQVTSVVCDPPKHPDNGKAVYTSVAYNSVVNYECKTGYTIAGDATRRCAADRKWSGNTPLCREINCGSPGVLYNGWIENIENGTGMGASLIYRCNDRMKLEGNSSTLCQADGKWRYPLPQCLAPCVVPRIMEGHVYVASEEHEHINNVTVAEHGKRLIVKCIDNFEFSGNSRPVVCNNGTWSVIPTCTPARCKQMPKPPKNGMAIAAKTDHGMRAIFKCKDGFKLVPGGPHNNSISVECRFGNWTGDVPHCVEVYCPFPGYVENGKVLLVGNMGVYDYRPYVKKVVNNKQIMYDCDKGYYLSEGPPGATCIGGTWRPNELPKCTLGQHPRIRWNRRRRSVSNDDFDNDTVATAYRRFVDFFRKIGKKLIELQIEKSQKEVNHKSETSNVDVSKNKSNVTTVQHIVNYHQPHKPHTKDERMVDFLKVVYRKLQRIDLKHLNNESNVSMHELLNVMSKNLFHIDLSEPRKNATAKAHESVEVKAQREFTKLKREFDRIMRFYNKSLRWTEKHSKKDWRKRDRAQVQGGKEKQRTKDKAKHKVSNHYKGFYDFVNDYVAQKLSTLQSQNATEELMRKMNIDKFVARNGTKFTVNEIYTFLKHIIEAKLNLPNTDSHNVSSTSMPLTSAMTPIKSSTSTSIPTTTSTTTSTSTISTSTLVVTTPMNIITHSASETSSARTTPVVKKSSVSENEIPTLGFGNGAAKLRSKRIRDAPSGTSAPFEKRKLLSINRPLNGDTRSWSRVKSLRSKPAELTLKRIVAQQRYRTKRFTPSSELDNQITLKHVYLKSYEDIYKKNVKRSASMNNHSRWSGIATYDGSYKNEHQYQDVK